MGRKRDIFLILRICLAHFIVDDLDLRESQEIGCGKPSARTLGVPRNLLGYGEFVGSSSGSYHPVLVDQGVDEASQKSAKPKLSTIEVQHELPLFDWVTCSIVKNLFKEST